MIFSELKVSCTFYATRKHVNITIVARQPRPMVYEDSNEESLIYGNLVVFVQYFLCRNECDMRSVKNIKFVKLVRSMLFHV